jgi:PAS domain S-box-containing protein
MERYRFYFLHLGVQPDYPEYLNQKIRVCNLTALFNGLLICLPFIAITYFLVPDLVYIALLGMVFCGMVLMMNRIGLHVPARILVALSPYMLLAWFHASLLDPGQPLIPGLLAIQMAFAVSPFIVFDLREKTWLTFSVLGLLVATFLFDQMVQWADSAYHTTLFSEGLLARLIVGLATSVLVFYVFSLSFIQYQMLRRNEKLLVSAASDQEKMYESETRMKQYLEELEVNKQQEAKRNWVTEGIARFSVILRNHDHLQALYDQLASGLVTYIGAQQGALYVPVEEEGEWVLKGVAFYACGRKKFMEQCVPPGEGLLGQAFLEKEIVYVNDLPENYLQITSGLGEAAPRNILIVPFMLAEQVVALFETASFAEFEPQVIEFLKKTGENIASTILSKQINEKTLKLLQETQVQTEQLQAQEEEMRLNVEEMQATQEEMARVQKELQKRELENQGMLAELRHIRENLEKELAVKLQEAEFQRDKIEVFLTTSSSTILFLDQQGNITDVNQAVTKMFGYKAEEVIGKNIDFLLQFADTTKGPVVEKLQEWKMKWAQADLVGKSKMYGFLFPAEVNIENGELAGTLIFTATIRDISKRKKQEESMKKSLLNLQDLQKNLQLKRKEVMECRQLLQQKDLMLKARDEEIETLKKHTS